MIFKKTFTFLFVLFFISTLLIPVAFVNKACFFLMIIIMLTGINKNTNLITISPIIIACIFIYGFVLSFFNVSDLTLSVQFLLSVAVLFLISPVLKYDIDLEKIIKISGLIVICYTGLFYLILVGFEGLGGAAFLDFFEKYSSGGQSHRSFTEEGVLTFQIGTTPFIYLPLALYVKSYIKNKKIKDLIAIILLFIAVFFSGLRGLMVSAVVTSLFLIFYYLKIVGKIVFLAIASIIFTIAISYILNNTFIFSSGEASNSVKIGHAESFIDNLNVFNTFTGNGLASFYYSKGRGMLVAHTEITPLDMIRYFGFILTIVLCFFMIFPSSKVSDYTKENKANFFIFIMYLINSFTNPILFNSYGLLIVLWYWFKILKPKKIIFQL